MDTSNLWARDLLLGTNNLTILLLPFNTMLNGEDINVLNALSALISGLTNSRLHGMVS